VQDRVSNCKKMVCHHCAGGLICEAVAKEAGLDKAGSVTIITNFPSECRASRSTKTIPGFPRLWRLQTATLAGQGQQWQERRMWV
jgi:hypothetical protein